ncbi:hypothetical protein [Patulibacter defluvii]|uniref:hypothetical protein n=1 Tax=Patulibacter defluvii TaxID=3095358 RepID=UPI002A7551EB|nr:hypothetical protein [Patulibacter sp. DM4]
MTLLVETPAGVLQIERVGSYRTYVARLDGGPWTAWGDLRGVVAEALGRDPQDEAVTAVLRPAAATTW